MMVCIAPGNGVCPSGEDWSSAAVVIVLILAIAGYKAWRTWLIYGRVGKSLEDE
jgi:hypothetical protein